MAEFFIKKDEAIILDMALKSLNPNKDHFYNNKNEIYFEEFYVNKLLMEENPLVKDIKDQSGKIQSLVFIATIYQQKIKPEVFSINLPMFVETQQTQPFLSSGGFLAVYKAERRERRLKLLKKSSVIAAIFFGLASIILTIKSISDKQEVQSLKQDIQQLTEERDSLKQVLGKPQKKPDSTDLKPYPKK